MPQDDHDTEKSSSSILKERRFKLSRACDRCRRRRIKCDEGHPCQACLSAGSPCTFEEPCKRSHPHKSKRTATLEDRMHHLETLIQAIPPAVLAAGGSSNVPPGTLSPMDSNSSPLAPFISPYQSGIPPPSLHVFPLLNPSTHFQDVKPGERQQSPHGSFRSLLGSQGTLMPDHLVEDSSRLSLTPYLYFDDEGYTRWQGETSGLPLLDVLVERHSPCPNRESSPHTDNSWSNGKCPPDWFPNRTPRRTDINPETLWRLITSYIVPELMDSLVQCYLSTSYYILPFLHVPSFLADYGNPQKWGEPGFAAFIVSICCLASRHMDDPRVRADPNDGISAGAHWFELLGRLRTLPISDRPTLYTIQADLIAAVYAVGLGKLSKAASLLSEAITVSIDAGLHRTSDTYDLFDSIEDEVRKRTFWCVYIWDKQLAAHFGRPPMIRLKDCDVGEPSPVDDEFITREGVSAPPPGTECRMNAFVCALRILVVMESVVDAPPARNIRSSSSFLVRANSMLFGSRRQRDMREEEALLDEIHRSVSPYWAYTPETLASDDAIRVTQAERLHCAEQFVRLLIHRQRFSDFVAERNAGAGSGPGSGAGGDEDQCEIEREAMAGAHRCAVQLVVAHLHIATKGFMTYYGVHVIHQLTQAGRTLVAILLNCKSENLQYLIQPSLDALRSCMGLLRRFSGRYVCGVRSGDLMEEFCRITQIPLESSNRSNGLSDNSRPPWIRPVPKKTHTSRSRSTHSGDSVSQHSSPERFSAFELFVDMNNNNEGSPPRSGPSYSPPSSMASSTHQTASPVIQGPPLLRQPYSNRHHSVDRGGGNSASPAPRASPFVDGSNGMGMDIIRPDPHLYLSPDEVMALFSDGSGVDVGSLFSPEFSQPPPDIRGRSVGGGGVNGVNGVGGGVGGVGGEGAFNGSSSFPKMEGLITSP